MEYVWKMTFFSQMRCANNSSKVIEFLFRKQTMQLYGLQKNNRQKVGTCTEALKRL